MRYCVPPARVLAFLAAAMAAATLMQPTTAEAGQRVYEYTIKHPQYGDIGTYTNIVEQSGDRIDVTTRVHVLVKILGLVVYRQDAERSELWQGGRLVSFTGITATNGKRAEIRGKAQGDTFVIDTPNGTAVGPADVRPSNPWSAAMFRGAALMSTTTGRLFWPQIVQREETLRLDGKPARLRRIDVLDNKHQVVWFDDRDVPVAFRTEEEGSPVDFVLADRNPELPQQRLSQALPGGER